MREFEPNAPPLEDRLDAIRHLAARGFCVNAMVEPYLSDPLAIADRALAVLPPAGIVAIGKMNYQANIEFFPGNPAKNAAAIEYLDELYNRENTMRLFEAVKANPRLFLKKDSVDAVLKHACHR